MANTDKYTAFHVPRSSSLLANARKLAEKIGEDLPISTRIPMYAAMEVAVLEALDRRLLTNARAPRPTAGPLTRREEDDTDQSPEVDC